MGLVQSRGQGLVQAGTVGRARLSRPVEHRIRPDPGHDMAPGLRLLVDVRAPGLALVLVLTTVPALGLGRKHRRASERRHGVQTDSLSDLRHHDPGQLLLTGPSLINRSSHPLLLNLPSEGHARFLDH